jgi:ABC-type Na+ efflux pump permease subunit
MDEISYSGPSSTRRRFSRRFVMFGLLALVVLLLLGGLVFFVTRKGSSSTDTTTITIPPTNEPTIEATPTSEESGTPSASPSKSPTKAPTGTSASAKSDISVAIENGSGAAGVAAKAADALKSAGYTIASTGNADSFDYTGVTIQVKSTEKGILTGLKSDLTNAGYSVTSATADLSAGQSYDALVIVGK